MTLHNFFFDINISLSLSPCVINYILFILSSSDIVGLELGNSKCTCLPAYPAKNYPGNHTWEHIENVVNAWIIVANFYHIYPKNPTSNTPCFALNIMSSFSWVQRPWGYGHCMYTHGCHKMKNLVAWSKVRTHKFLFARHTSLPWWQPLTSLYLDMC